MNPHILDKAVHIVIVSAVYSPEPQVSARMSFELADYLDNQGVRVTVLCPQPSRPLNADYSKYQCSSKPLVIAEKNVTVVRLPSFTAPESSLLPRLYESCSFGRHVCNYLKNNVQKPDVIYVNAWPLFAQAMIVHYAKINRIPVVLQIMDIYPESLLGKLPAVIRELTSFPLLKLDRWIARQARSVVTISDNMRSTYIESRRIPSHRILTIPTWQDDTIFEQIPERSVACSKYGIPVNLFTFLYLGNIGPVAGVDFLIRAFCEAEIDEAQLVIVGDGSAKADCIRLAGRLNSANVHFISDPDAANVPLLQSIAHVCLLPMKVGTGMSSIPSKLPAYLFSAKTVLATVDPDSDTARLIQAAQCGWVGPPEDLGWLVSMMKSVAELPLAELTKYGQQGRVFGLANFSKAEGLNLLSKQLLSVALH